MHAAGCGCGGGEFDPARLKNYAKLARELLRAETLEDVRAMRRRKLDAGMAVRKGG